MLLIDLLVTAPCPKDANLAALIEVGKQRVQFAKGHEFRPVYGGQYAAGIGEGWPEIKAPVALQPGDAVRVTGEDKLVYDVRRGPATVFEGRAAKNEAARIAALEAEAE